MIFCCYLEHKGWSLHADITLKVASCKGFFFLPNFKNFIFLCKGQNASALNPGRCSYSKQMFLTEAEQKKAFTISPACGSVSCKNCDYWKSFPLYNFPRVVSKVAQSKEQLHIAFWFSCVFFFLHPDIIRCLSSASPHNDININAYGNALFSSRPLIHIWFINVMNARNDQIICSCVLDMQWGVLVWLKFKIGMPKLH